MRRVWDGKYYEYGNSCPVGIEAFSETSSALILTGLSMCLRSGISFAFKDARQLPPAHQE